MGIASDLFNESQNQANAPDLETPKLDTVQSLYGDPQSMAEDRLKTVVESSIDETPERAARALEIQNRTGIPKKFIDDNFDDLDKAAKQADFNHREFMKTSPKVADWILRNPEYAPLIRDDIDTVGGLEKFFAEGESWSSVLQKRTESAGHSLNVQLGGIQQTIAMARQNPSEFAGHFGQQINRAAAKGLAYIFTPNWALNDEQRKTRDSFLNRITPEPSYSKQALEAVAQDPLFIEGMDRASYHIGRMKELQTQVPEWSGKDIVGSAYESFLTSVLPMLATAYAGGGVIGGTTTFSAQVYTQNLAESLDEGMPLSKAQEYASWKILSEGIPEALPLSVAMKAGKGFWSKTLGVALTEGMEEGLTEMADIAYETQKLDKDISFKEAVNRTFKAMTVGGFTGGGMGAVSSVTDVADRYKAKKQAKLQENFFKSLGDNATNSKLFERLPESYQQLVKDITKDGPVENVYAPVEFFQSHFQEQGIDPAQLSKEMGIERQYQEAVNTGGKIAIPTDIYARNLAPTEHNAVFAKELSFAPDQMSSRETEDFLKEAEKEKPEETDKFRESLEQAMTPIREQILKLYPADIAEKNATVIEARLRARADRLGVDPQELMKRRPISITEGEGGTGATLNQGQKRTPHLILQHNLTGANLLHAKRMGGLAVPSLAVTSTSAPMLNFGEITLLGNKEMADPKGYARTRVFGGDIYSPRAPTINYKIDSKKLDAMAEKLKPFSDQVKESEVWKIHEQLRDEGARAFENSSQVMAAFLTEKGISYKVSKKDESWQTRGKLRDLIEKKDLMNEFSEYADKLFQELEPVERIFRGFTDSGNRRYIANTLDNVVAILKHDIRGGENFNYGAGSVRAAHTPQFRTVKQIIANEGRLMSKEQFESLKEEMNNELISVADELKPFYKYDKERFGYYDEASGALAEAGKLGLSRSLKEYGFENVSDDVITKARSFISKLVDLPTEYFEAKILRGVDLAEFKVAVVPENTSQSVLDALAERGVKVETYPKGNEVLRAQAIKAAAEKYSDEVLFQGKEITRGSISVTPTGDIIRLFQSRNLSTLLHEFGHRWLFELQDDAALPNAPQQIKDDLAKALKYLGVESVEELDITKHKPGTEGHKKAVAANEKWAQSIEAYLKEGKAPSTALRRVFAQIKAWLVAVYDALKQGRLDVDLNPEIRGVFDRLLATDQEIKAARAEANIVPIGTTAVDAGMTDTEFAAYRKTIEDANREAQEEIDAKIMAEYKRTLTDVWKEEKAKVQAEVEAELDKEPIYQAMAKMEANGIKIARAEAKNLPRNLTAKDGIPADMAAEMLGFASGDSLILSLASVENRKSRVSRETNLRMDQRFGNMLTDGTIVEEARNALANDTRAKVIEAEIKALNKKAREVKPFIKAKEKAEAEAERAGREMYRGLVPQLADVRQHAKEVISGKPIRELKPMTYFNTARQASRQAMEAVRKKDYLLAAFHKGRELLNMELYKEAIKTNDMVDTSLDKLNKVFVSDIKQAKTRNLDMVNAARAILASHGIGRSDEAPTVYLEKLRQYDPEVYESLRPQFEPAIQSMKPYKEMTVEEFIGMRDSVLALMDQSRRSKQIEVDGKLLDREQVVSELVDSLGKFKKRDVRKFVGEADKWEGTKVGILGARAILRRVEHWVDAMDGGDPDGVFRKYLLNPVIDSINEYRDAKRQKLVEYLNLVKSVETTLTRDNIDAPELGEGVYFRGKVSLLHAILHTGNESNLRKLLVGYGWAEVLDDGTLNTARWDSFINRMQDEGVLTKADYDFAQGVWDMMESMKPKAQEAHKRMYGYYFDEVTANEFSNRFGTYKGGYVPAITDPTIVTDAAIRKDREELLNGQNSFAFPTTGRGATMKRIESYAKPLQLDMRTIPAHIDWAMRFSYIEPAVKDVGRVVINRDFRSALDAIDPAAARHMLMPWLQRSAKQIISTPGMLPWVDKLWREVRTRTGMQIMVTNVINTLQQFTGLSTAATKVKPRNLKTALWQYMTNHKEVNETISGKSAFMRNRIFTSQVEIQQTIDDLLLNPSKYEKARDFALKHGYFMQQGTQSIVDKITWLAAYNEGIQNDMNEKESIRHADSVVRETQGSFAAEDISRFEAGTPFMRAFSMFYNYFNMQANLLGTEFQNIATRKLGLKKGAGRALYLYVFGFLIPAYIGDTLIRALISGMPDDDDDGYMDEFIAAFFDSQVRAATAMVPIVGPAVMAGINAWNKKWYDDRITTSPAVSMIESTVRAPYSVYKAISDDGNQKRAVQDTLTAIGMFTGFPAGALGRPIGYIADVMQDKAEPESALDVVRGLVSGKDVNRER